MSTATRRSALAQALPDDTDAMLVTGLVNVRYLTGFTGSSAALLLSRDETAVLATDGRYVEQASAEATGTELLVTRALGPDLVRRAVATGLRRVALERQHVTLAAYDALVDAAGDDAVFTDAGQPVERLRVRKDDEEIAALTRACAITDAAYAAVLPALRPGVSERDVAWLLLQEMRARGADGAAFDSIVAFGPNSAVPHHQPTDRPLQRGDLVKLDFGARVAGYHADMTRTVVCGSAAQWQRELHGQVLEVQQRCRAATVAGAEPIDLDTLAHDLVAASGHELMHGLGHGVGLEIHEQPFLVPRTTAATLEDRVPVTVEPGIYLAGRGGVRIEDTVLVGATGAEPLTTSTRELLET